MLAYDLPPSTDEARAAAVAEFQAVVAEFRRLALRGAHALAELKRTGAHFRAGAGSIAHFGEMNGMSAHDARQLEHLSRALQTDPCLAADVERGAVPVASAAILGEIALWPPEVRTTDPWLSWAKTRSTKEFRRLFLHRRDEVRAGEPVVSVTTFVTRTVRDDLDRAVELTSRAAHMPLSLGQTIGIVVGDWLADHDPLRVKPGTRRLPDTAQIPGSRYVPAEVDRHVRSRSGDRCRVPFCDNAFWVHRSHRVPHREGSSRETDALDLLCDYHHVLYERGLLRIEGPADAPVFKDADGRRLDERRPFTGSGESPGSERGPPCVPPAA